jgi:ABC-type lipoprotein release transport system permease subunit
MILLYAYIDGSRRQLDLQNTVFSGEVTFSLKSVPKEIPGKIFEEQILSSLSEEDREVLSVYRYSEEEKSYAITEALKHDHKLRISKLLYQAGYNWLPGGFEKKLKENIPSLLYMSKKLKTFVQYRVAKKRAIGYAKLIGVDLEQDKRLAEFLTLKQGRFPESDREILIPSSLLESYDVALDDIIRVSGETSSRLLNRGAYKIVGIYNSPGLSLVANPQFIVTYNALDQFLKPYANDIEYCLFFENGVIPRNINVLVRESADDTKNKKIDSIEARFISIMDLLNISVQFNVFLAIIITVTIMVLITLVTVVNFNIYLIIFRGEHKEIGTLLSFGVPSWKISLTLFLRSFVQIVICTVSGVLICYIISSITAQQLMSGFMESLFVLLTGTNKLDFFIKLEHIVITFSIIFTAVTISQIPIFIRILFNDPIEIMQL